MSEAFSWQPEERHLKSSNAALLCAKLGLKTFGELHRWSTTHREDYWKGVAKDLGIRFTREPQSYVTWNSPAGLSSYLDGARLNIVESCFLAPPAAPALIEENEAGEARRLSFAELKGQSRAVAAALHGLGFKAGDALAIDMPMTVEAVMAYLGALWMGARVVSIADSFAPDEIASRLRIGQAKWVLTQDVIKRGGKSLPMFAKVAQASGVPAIVVPTGGERALPTPAEGLALREGDLWWGDFLAKGDGGFPEFQGPGMHVINVLFSSGTTGDPKAIPWTQSTPLKCAADARYHHDVRAGDLLCWPTNLGWMMGPWLLFAAFLNRAGVALYTGSPLEKGFADFVSRHHVTMLGVVPSLVKTWRLNRAFEGSDLGALKAFSSTGECSNPDDMTYLMQLANAPVIEYCGGTEIGGAYVTSSVMEPNYPSMFSTPTLGLDLVLLDEQHRPTDNGEVFLVPPSVGLSTVLLTGGPANHFEKYFEGTPAGPHGEVLRRHGDQLVRLQNGYYQAIGRTDDSMNLGGIKVGSAEIERVTLETGLVADCAAIAIPPAGGGPSLLVLFAVIPTAANVRAVAAPRLIDGLQKAIRDKLNPLFKIHEVVEVSALPRTASNKVMRRVLRDDYLKSRAAADAKGETK